MVVAIFCLLTYCQAGISFCRGSLHNWGWRLPRVFQILRLSKRSSFSCGCHFTLLPAQSQSNSLSLSPNSLFNSPPTYLSSIPFSFQPMLFTPYPVQKTHQPRHKSVILRVKSLFLSFLCHIPVSLLNRATIYLRRGPPMALPPLVKNLKMIVDKEKSDLMHVGFWILIPPKVAALVPC